MSEYKVSGKLGSGARYKHLVAALKKKGAKNPGALAGYIGRKRWGNKRMAKMAAAGRKEG